MMKQKGTRYLAIIILGLMSMTAAAHEQPMDTVCFYINWEQMMYNEPECVFYGSDMIEYSIMDVAFCVKEPDIQQVMNTAVAASLGDSIWLINTRYLLGHFKGVKYADRSYVPLVFTDKIAYISLYSDFPEIKAENYYLDFKNRELLKVDSNVLSSLLEDYHDMQMRYEGMKDYKKYYIINDFFLRYVHRASADPMKPYILDLVDQDGL